MVGRNDSCPCGSGKKYKKCHGKEQVVDMHALIDAEIKQVMEGFLEEGLEPKDFHEVHTRVKRWHAVLSPLFERNLIESAAFESFLYIERKEIWQHYLDRQLKKQKRGQVLDVLKAYREPFFLLAEVAGQKGKDLTVIDKVSGKTHRLQADKRYPIGDWVFGIVMEEPRAGEGGIEAMDSFLTISSFQDDLIGALLEELEDFKGDSLKLYQLFKELNKEPVLTVFQEQAMALVLEFVGEFQLDENLIEPMAKAFLLREPLNAKKPEALAAGMLQALNDHGLFKAHYMTQSSLSKRFGVSTATLGKYRDKMEQFLQEIIEEAALEKPELPNLLEMMDRLDTMDLSEMQEMMDVLDTGDMPDLFEFEGMDDSPYTVVEEMGTDPGIIEQKLWGTVKRVKHSPHHSQKELNKLIQKYKDLEYEPVNGSEAAQKLCYEAYKAANDSKRYELAKKAFGRDPKNVDANLLMAEQELDSLQKKTHYLQAINTGYRNFDSGFENAWEFVLNRPLLRALFAYGAWLMAQGEYKEAIEQFEEILERNSADHQGAKWLLASTYIQAGEWEKADLLLMEFPGDDNETVKHYFDCILDIHEGDIDEEYIREMNEDSKRLNRYVNKFLIEGKNPGAFPRKLLLAPGSEDEAKLVYWLIYGMPGIAKLV